MVRPRVSNDSKLQRSDTCIKSCNYGGSSSKRSSVVTSYFSAIMPKSTSSYNSPAKRVSTDIRLSTGLTSHHANKNMTFTRVNYVAANNTIRIDKSAEKIIHYYLVKVSYVPFSHLSKCTAQLCIPFTTLTQRIEP